MLAHLKDTSEWRLLWLQKLGSQLGVATENLGVVRTSSLTFWPRSASDHAEFVHMQRVHKYFFIIKLKYFKKLKKKLYIRGRRKLRLDHPVV